MSDYPQLRVIRKTYQKLVQPESGQPRKLHPLDLILFDGDSAEVEGSDLISGLIKIVSNLQTGHHKAGNEIATPSHLGIVVTRALMPYVPQLEPGKFYVMESTFSYPIKVGKRKVVSGPVNITTGEGKFGVQIRDLEKVVNAYNGVIYRGRTMKNPWVWKKGEPYGDAENRRAGVIQVFSEFYARFRDKRYNYNPLHLGAAVFAPLRPFRSVVAKGVRAGEIVVGQKGRISDSVICSEFVAHALKAVGLLPPDFNCKNFIPVDVTGVDADGAPRLICPTLYQMLPAV